MGLRIELLDARAEGAYEQVVRGSDTGLLYTSLKYRDFLAQVLPQSEALYLTAYDGNEMVGVMPAFLRRNATFGNVLNSLPFYGSNGGPVVGREARDPDAVRRALVREFGVLAVEHAVVASTIVSSPFDGDVSWHESEASQIFRDERSGQITPLPSLHADGETARAALTAAWHPKTRYSVRKAEAASFTVRESGTEESLRILARIHQDNLEALGGLPKSWRVFETLAAVFSHGEDYVVWIAEKGGLPVAALLVFFFRGVAEYFTPAVRAEYRALQPLSLLIRDAMLDAMRRGCRHWNWGGTWRTQESLHRFKKRWGTIDRPYVYHTQVYDVSVLAWSRETILREYPYYFVVPFSALR